MAEQSVSQVLPGVQNARKSSTAKYYTRYGITTASDAALDLLDRVRFRVALIGTLFQKCGEDGYDVTIGGYEACGLACLLEDIGHDIQTASNYYYGDDNTPGKLHGAPEVKS